MCWRGDDHGCFTRCSGRGQKHCSCAGLLGPLRRRQHSAHRLGTSSGRDDVNWEIGESACRFTTISTRYPSVVSRASWLARRRPSACSSAAPPSPRYPLETHKTPRAIRPKTLPTRARPPPTRLTSPTRREKPSLPPPSNPPNPFHSSPPPRPPPKPR